MDIKLITKPIGKNYRDYCDEDGYINVDIEVDIDEIINCKGIKDFNDMLQERIISKHYDYFLEDINYSIQSGKPGKGFCGGTIILRVNAQVENFDE